MPNPTWPAGLPQYVMQQGFSEKLPDMLLETQMEAGPAKARRRYTSDYRLFSVSVAMTAAQRATFETFFITTVMGGSLPFDWKDPVTQANATFRFKKPVPQFGIRGETHIASFALEKIT
jgi:hypothetical protein